MKLSDIEEWEKSKGIGIFNIPNDIGKLFTYNFSDLYKKNHSEVIEIVYKVSSYKLFISNELGRLSSALQINRSRLNNELFLETQKLDKFMNIDEKKAYVIKNNNKINSLNSIYLENQYKFDRIKNFYDGLQSFLFVLYKVLEVKREEQFGRKISSFGDNKES